MKASKKKRQRNCFPLIGIAAMLMVSWVLTGCRSVEKVSEVGAVVGVATGLLTDGQAESIRKSTVAVAKSFQDFTPEQEYYLGRSVGERVAPFLFGGYSEKFAINRKYDILLSRHIGCRAINLF